MHLFEVAVYRFIVLKAEYTVDNVFGRQYIKVGYFNHFAHEELSILREHKCKQACMHHELLGVDHDPQVLERPIHEYASSKRAKDENVHNDTHCVCEVHKTI